MVDNVVCVFCNETFTQDQWKKRHDQNLRGDPVQGPAHFECCDREGVCFQLLRAVKKDDDEFEWLIDRLPEP